MHSNNVSIADLTLQAGNNDPDQHIFEDYGSEDLEFDLESNDEEISLQVTQCPLNENEMQRLRDTINVIENYQSVSHGVELFKAVMLFIEALNESNVNSDAVN